MKSVPPIIRDIKLGRERAAGQYEHGTRVTEIDPRQDAFDRLDTVIHETIHYIWPDMAEESVSKAATVLAKTLWKDRYRRTER